MRKSICSQPPLIDHAATFGVGLELRLGLSTGASRAQHYGRTRTHACQKNQHATAHLISVADKELASVIMQTDGPAGFSQQASWPESCAGGCESEMNAHAAKVLDSSCLHCCKQEDGMAEFSSKSHPTTAWHDLRNSRVLLPEMAMPPSTVCCEGVITLPKLNGAAAAIYAQRALTTDSFPPMRVMNCPPTSLACQVFGTDPLQDKSLDMSNDGLAYQQQKEALELQKKRELQAHKRQEARKRRKTLIEEKQQKKSKKEDMKSALQARGLPGNIGKTMNTSPASEPSLTGPGPVYRVTPWRNNEIQSESFVHGPGQFHEASALAQQLNFCHTSSSSGEKLLLRERSLDSTLASTFDVMQRHPQLSSTPEAVAQGRENPEPSPSPTMGNNSVSSLSESEIERGESLIYPEEGMNSGEVPQSTAGVGISCSDQETCNAQQAVDVRPNLTGMGFFPKLHWVSTTGTGPNGKTVTGVMYICNRNQVMIVCTCHRKHLSPSDFVLHAGSTNLSNPERSIVVSPFPFPLPLQTASARA